MGVPNDGEALEPARAGQRDAGGASSAAVSPRPDFVGDAYSRVTDLGDGRRWYDLPYRALNGIRRRRSLFNRLPFPVRRGIIYGINYLMQFHSHEVHIAWSPEDPFHNVKVPDGEHVRIPALWVLEFFPPSQVAQLSNSIKRNSWDLGRLRIDPSESNQALLDRSRTGEGWSYWNLAHISSPGGPYRIPDGQVQDLPPAFDAIELVAVQVGDGLTAVLAYFHVSEQASQDLDKTWHKQHEPELIRDKGALPRPLDRMWTKFRNTQRTRRSIHDSARFWLSEHCPGVFASRGEPQPVVDLLLLDQFDPTEVDTVDSQIYDPMRALGLTEFTVEQRTSGQMPGLLLDPSSETLCPDLGGRRTFALWGQRARVAEGLGVRAFSGGDPDREISEVVHRRVQNFFILLGTTELLQLFRQQYGRLRDGARAQHGRFKNRYIKELRSSFLTLSLDITSINRDLKRHREPPIGSVEFSTKLVRLAANEPADPPRSLNSYLRERQETLTEELLAADRDYRDILSTVASLGSSSDAYRVGRLVLLLALASLVVAVATLFQ